MADIAHSRPEPRLEPLPPPAKVTPVPLPSESLPADVTLRERPSAPMPSSIERDHAAEIPETIAPEPAPPVSAPESPRVVVDEPVVPEIAPLPEEAVAPVPIPEPKVFSMTAPPAVLALENEIEGDIRSGNLGDAAASLERAIRIQPKNAELWHVLADIRLKQQQPGLAEDLAKKSTLMARNNPELVRQNWRIIAEARRLRGDYSGASEAASNAGD